MGQASPGGQASPEALMMAKRLEMIGQFPGLSHMGGEKIKLIVEKRKLTSDEYHSLRILFPFLT